MRAIAYSQPGRLELQSRNLNDITGSYPELRRLNRALSSHSAILDGEIVAFDEDGRPSFAALQHRMHVSSTAQAGRLAKSTPVTYMIFDLLWLDGHSLMGLPYAERRERLAALELSGESWQTPEHVLGDGRAVLEASAAQGLEGIVAKRLDSTYEPGRRSAAAGSRSRTSTARSSWSAAGCPARARRAEAHRRAARRRLRRATASSRYAGRVGSGFTEQELDRLAGLLGRARAHRVAVLRRVRAPAARRGLLRAEARGRGRVHRVDRARQPAPSRLPGPAR